MVSISSSLLFILIISSEYYSGTAFGLPGLGDIQTYANFANDAIGVLKGDLPITALLTGSTGPTLDKILDSISDISKQLDDFGDKFRAQLDAQSERFDERFDEINGKLDKILIDLPLDDKALQLTRELHAYIVRIDDLYSKYERYSMGRDQFNNYTIKKFIEAVTSDRQGDLGDVLSRMFALLLPERSVGFTDGIFDVLALQMAKSKDIICGTRISEQMQLYEIYESVIITETRGFIMSIFAYAMISIFKRTSFNSELDFQRDQLVKRTDRYLKIAAKSMQRLPQNVELCDASRYVEGIDYVKLDSFDGDGPLKGRSISAMAQIADIENNMVISGIRFVNKNDDMIECQIQQTRLLPQGVIDKNQSWKELPRLIFNGKGDNYYKFSNGTKVEPIQLIGLGRRDTRALLLNDVVLPNNYALAGVQLQQEWQYMYLSLYGVKFDFETGKLDPHDTIWHDSDYIQDPNDLWQALPKLKLPTEAEKNFVDSKHGDVVMMGPVVGAQSPVAPFFDARPVEVRSMSLALSGLGLFHRGAPGYGGYINFRLLTIDLSEYVKY